MTDKVFKFAFVDRASKVWIVHQQQAANNPRRGAVDTGAHEEGRHRIRVDQQSIARIRGCAVLFREKTNKVK